MSNRAETVRTWAAAMLGFLLVLDTLVVLAIGGGVNLGTLLPGAVGAAVLSWLSPSVRRLIARARRVRSYLLFALIPPVLIFAAVECGIVMSAFPREPAQADWILVLGSGLRGSRPSLTLVNRLERARELAARFPEARIVVSGGQGPGETMTEAEAMAGWLARWGLPPGRIVHEPKATSTIENLLFSRRIMQETGPAGPNNVVIVSSEFHLFRAAMLARRAGYVSFRLAAAPSPWYLYPNTFGREFLAVLKSWALDRPPGTAGDLARVNDD